MNKELLELRTSLLQLHKELLDYQTTHYEADHEKITSKGKLFDLVVGDPAFMWLRQLSELIVGMDSMLEPGEEPTEENIHSFLAYTQQLLTPSETGNEFAQKYYQAIHSTPPVTLQHGKVMESLSALLA